MENCLNSIIYVVWIWVRGILNSMVLLNDEQLQHSNVVKFALLHAYDTNVFAL